MEHLFIVLFLILMWGTAPVIYKHFLEKVNFKTIMVVLGFVSFLCALSLFAMNSETVIKDITKLPTQKLILLCLMIVVSFFIGQTLYMYVLNDNPSYAVSAIYASLPVVTLLISASFLSEPIGWPGILGVVLTSAGVATIALNGTSPK